MPQAASESYERWSLWRDHVSATFQAFLSDDAAAKRAGEYHVELMHRGLNQAGVDVATAWAAPSVEPHEALLMMGLYETHARWKLNVVAGEWRHVNHPAQAPTQGAAPRGQGPQTTDPVRAEIAVLEARLAQLRGPSVPQLSLGELQRVANMQLHYAWQCQVVETLFIFLRSEAATGRANATTSNPSPSPPSSRNRNGSRRWLSRRHRGGARQGGSLSTETRPCTRRSVPGARMTRVPPPPTRA